MSDAGGVDHGECSSSAAAGGELGGMGAGGEVVEEVEVGFRCAGINCPRPLLEDGGDDA